MEGLPDSSLMLILIICILFSAFFSASETAYSTCNKIRLKQLANRGDDRSEKVLRLAEEYDKLISGILVGNNFVNIFASTLATLLFTKMLAENGATVSTVVMTIVVLIFGEITPKTIAKNNPDEIVLTFYPLLKFILTILTPFTFVFGLWQNLINLIFKPSDNKGMSGEELITMIEEVEKEGSIEKEESELIQSAIEFGDANIAEIYTPRVDVVTFDIKEGFEKAKEIFKETTYSRIPVYDKSIDNIVGFLHQKDFYNLENEDIESIIQTPIYLPLTTHISDALKQMQKNKIHLAIVCDEFGGTAGLVTLEDIIEELVGEIYDEHDEIIEEIIQLDESIYKIDGSININEVFDLYEMYEEDVYDSNTISGFIIEINERIPNKGDIIHFKELIFEILESNDKTIQWIKVSKIKNS